MCLNLNNIVASKKELRRIISARKKKYTCGELRSMSPFILHKLEELQIFKESSVILLYHSLPDEVDTHSFIEKWSSHKTILLPVIEENTIKLRYFLSVREMSTGKFSIREPAGEICTDYAVIDLAIIPGVGFDRELNRLGRGKGYYDRLLQSVQCPKVGICFDFQLMEKIPVDNTDISMDLVITENECFNKHFQ